VLYLVTLSHEQNLSPTDNTPFSLANRLIRSGKLPAVIVIVPDQLVGAGSDVALTKDLVPYVDGKYRTIRDRLHRGVGGVSNGAAIAVRMGFQFPEIFGSVGMLSGGIADNEGPRFTEWIQRTPADQWPRLHIDVGDQDSGILNLLHNLLPVLDANHVPYTLNVGHGDHNWAFWSPLMEPYLMWFSKAW
jgi:enterochelin esterase-like enzyme